MVGRNPSQSLPWHFNVCRQRIREHGSEYSAFAPTGKMSFHVPVKFAHFYDGRSHAFDIDETVTNWLIESSAADKLMSSRKFEEALAAFVVLSNRGKATDCQKSHALSQACACLAKDFETAADLATQIPLEAASKTSQMQNLLTERKWDAVIEQFGSEDFSQWPFTQIGAAAFERGRAYYAAKSGEKADDDLRSPSIPPSGTAKPKPVEPAERTTKGDVVSKESKAQMKEAKRKAKAHAGVP